MADSGAVVYNKYEANIVFLNEEGGSESQVSLNFLAKLKQLCQDEGFKYQCNVTYLGKVNTGKVYKVKLYFPANIDRDKDAADGKVSYKFPYRWQEDPNLNLVNKMCARFRPEPIGDCVFFEFDTDHAFRVATSKIPREYIDSGYITLYEEANEN